MLIISKFSSGSPIWLTTLTLAAAIGHHSVASAQTDESRTSELLTGTLAFFGCEVDPADVLLRARPVSAVGADGTEVSPTDRVHMAHLKRGSASSFAYAFEQLAADTIYTLGVKIVGASGHRCGQVEWRSSRAPFVTGGDAPLNFEAYAVRSELELLGAAERRGKERWVAADNLDFADAQTATRRFRWRTTIPGVTGGVLQVSLHPFPKPGGRLYDPCDTRSVVYSKSFPYGNAIDSRTGDVAPDGWVDVGPVDFHALFGGERVDRDTSRAEDLSLQLELGRPVYVRVVPTIEGRSICDAETGGIPPEVKLAKVLKQLLDTLPGENSIAVVQAIYTPPWLDPNHPKAGERCYRVTKPHPVSPDPAKYPPFGFANNWDFWLYATGHGNGAVGSLFCVNIATDDDGWFESFVSEIGDVVSAAVDGLAELVNFASQVWEELQDKVVAATKAGLEGLGVDCDASCQKLLETGLELALASMGVPPSLPNFDQLMDQGLDYVAAEVAAQTNVPEPIANLATQKAKQFVQKAAANMRHTYNVPGLPDWLVADVLLEPAILTLDLRGPAWAFPTTPRLIRNNDPIFTGATLVLPKKLPSGTEPPLRVPMVLPPNVYGLPEPPKGSCEYCKADWYKDKWHKLRLKNGCYQLAMTAIVTGDIFPLVSGTFLAKNGAPCAK